MQGFVLSDCSATTSMYSEVGATSGSPLKTKSQPSPSVTIRPTTPCEASAARARQVEADPLFVFGQLPSLDVDWTSTSASRPASASAIARPGSASSTSIVGAGASLHGSAVHSRQGSASHHHRPPRSGSAGGRSDATHPPPTHKSEGRGDEEQEEKDDAQAAAGGACYGGYSTRPLSSMSRMGGPLGSTTAVVHGNVPVTVIAAKMQTALRQSSSVSAVDTAAAAASTNHSSAAAAVTGKGWFASSSSSRNGTTHHRSSSSSIFVRSLSRALRRSQRDTSTTSGSSAVMSGHDRSGALSGDTTIPNNLSSSPLAATHEQPTRELSSASAARRRRLKIPVALFSRRSRFELPEADAYRPLSALERTAARSPHPFEDGGEGKEVEVAEEEESVSAPRGGARNQQEEHPSSGRSVVADDAGTVAHQAQPLSTTNPTTVDPNHATTMPPPSRHLNDPLHRSSPLRDEKPHKPFHEQHYTCNIAEHLAVREELSPRSRYLQELRDVRCETKSLLAQQTRQQRRVVDERQLQMRQDRHFWITHRAPRSVDLNAMLPDRGNNHRVFADAIREVPRGAAAESKFDSALAQSIWNAEEKRRFAEWVEAGGEAAKNPGVVKSQTKKVHW